MARVKPYSINRLKFLSDTEQTELRLVLDRNLITDARNATLLLYLLRTGARITEALLLEVNDLNPIDKTVLIRGIKGSSDRELPLPDKLFDALVKLSGPETLIFGISYSRAVQIWQLYRPCAKKLHALRHTFAIELFKKTKDLRLVQFALGHKNIQNTMVYAQYVYTTAELKRTLL